MTKQEILAYAAGIVDGEGCIGIRTCQARGTWHMVVTVGNTSLELLEQMRSWFGGSVTFQERNPGRKTFYQWKVSAMRAGCFLRMILPYLIIKKDRAVVALKFQDTMGVPGQPVHPGLKRKRARLADRIRLLNRTGEDT